MFRKLLFSALLVLATAAHADMLITNVFDGPLTGGIPKGIELYVTSDIADLSIYGVGAANNGGGTDGQEFTFPADSISAGHYIYLATEANAFTEFFGFPPDYTHGTAVSINGDDAIELFRDGLVVDLFGDINLSGTGQAWDYLDGWAARKSGSTASAIFNSSDWTFSGPNALDGAATNEQAATPIPLMSFTDAGNGGGDGGSGGDGNGEPVVVTLISVIQGNPSTYGSNAFGETDVSPLIDTQVTIEGIVVGDFQRNDADSSRDVSGFFVQEEITDEDGNPDSSEGIFVYDNLFGVDVALGDRVRVSGTVDQYFGETQLSNVSAVEVLESMQLDLVSAASISLLTSSAVTVNQNGKYQPDLEAFEGMLVNFPESLQITEQFQLDRFNEIKLIAGERPMQFTQLNVPDVALNDAWLAAQGARTITYDDGLNVQNAAIGLLDGFANYNEANAKRMGDQVFNLTGILDYKWAGNGASGSTWRVRSHIDDVNIFTSTEAGNSNNPRPLEAPQVEGSLKISSFNVLNFFTTIDLSGVVTAAGHDPRGADSIEEFNRQLAKTVNAINQLDADVLGLIEIENDFDPINDGSTAVEVLVNALNNSAGANVYDYVYPGSQFVGTDAIAVAIIYKPAVVKIAESSVPAQLDDTVAASLDIFSDRDFASDPLFNGIATNRVSLAVSFTHLESNDSFTVVANHFKSKGSSGLDDSGSDLYDPASPNYDQLDGAGFWNTRRTEAANAVDAWMQTSPTGLNDDDIVLLGDFNAYAMEEPIQYLLENGYNNVETETAYSYVFDGQTGTLDYVLLSDALMEKFAEAALWHINADEADALDYNLDFGKDASCFDGTTATRNSDHDPLIVGLHLLADEINIGDLITALLSAYDSGEIDGTGRHALVRLLNKLRFLAILYTAAELEERGNSQQACTALKLAHLRSDDDRSPTDIVEGSGVADLNNQIKQALEKKACFK